MKAVLAALSRKIKREPAWAGYVIRTIVGIGVYLAGDHVDEELSGFLVILVDTIITPLVREMVTPTED